MCNFLGGNNITNFPSIMNARINNKSGKMLTPAYPSCKLTQMIPLGGKKGSICVSIWHIISGNDKTFYAYSQVITYQR